MTHFELLQDMERKHDELLIRLDELDKRVEKTLAQCLPPPASPSTTSGRVTIADGRPATAH